ncbi:MAG TPA: integrase family protein [Rhizomicrobium sp.]|jgi:integrase|nr:integrase family protein [Rhizomicrobium sp.]
MRLTDLSIKTLKVPENGAVIYHDDVLTGFGVRVSEGGTKSFVLTHGKTRQRATIGRVGILALQEARGAAKRLLAEKTLGKASTVINRTWDAATVEYLAEVKKNCKPRTCDDYTRLLSRFKFGATLIHRLGQEDLTTKLDKLRDTPAEYIHAFVVHRAFFNWCYRHRYLNESPLARMQVGQYNERERVLSDGEIKKVWCACPPTTYGRIVKQLILTGQRRGEVVAYDPDWKEGDLITAPSWLAKNNKPHCYPIGPMTEALLGENSWKGWSKAKSQLDQRSGVYGWTLHDLRRTLRTHWAALGIRKEVAKKYVNQISGEDKAGDKIDRIYDRHTYIPEMRDAVKKWEAHLQTILKN